MPPTQKTSVILNISRPTVGRIDSLDSIIPLHFRRHSTPENMTASRARDVLEMTCLSFLARARDVPRKCPGLSQLQRQGCGHSEARRDLDCLHLRRSAELRPTSGLRGKAMINEVKSAGACVRPRARAMCCEMSCLPSSLARA